MKQQRGFTIIELMMATIVFSLVLLTMLSSFLQIGRLFYKGLTLSRVSETARIISEDIVSNIRVEKSASVTSVFGPVTVTGAPVPGGGTVTRQAYYFCTGSFRYTMLINHVVDAVQTGYSSRNYGLRKDYVGASGCMNPYGPPINFQSEGNAKEMLGPGMRIAHRNDITITPRAGGLYDVHVHVTYGDDDLFEDTTLPAGSDIGTRPGVLCSGSIGGSQFCTTSTIDTSVNAFGI